MKLAGQGLLDAVRNSPSLTKGVNVFQGKITYKAVAEALGMEYTPIESMI
jgi:alanine dehydrogenase